MPSPIRTDLARVQYLSLLREVGLQFLSDSLLPKLQRHHLQMMFFVPFENHAEEELSWPMPIVSMMSASALSDCAALTTLQSLQLPPCKRQRATALHPTQQVEGKRALLALEREPRFHGSNRSPGFCRIPLGQFASNWSILLHLLWTLNQQILLGSIPLRISANLAQSLIICAIARDSWPRKLYGTCQCVCFRQIRFFRTLLQSLDACIGTRLLCLNWQSLLSRPRQRPCQHFRLRFELEKLLLCFVLQSLRNHPRLQSTVGSLWRTDVRGVRVSLLQLSARAPSKSLLVGGPGSAPSTTRPSNTSGGGNAGSAYPSSSGISAAEPSQPRF